MNSYLRNISIIILSAALLFSCGDDNDDYVYPDIYNEFVDLATDSQGTVVLLTTDVGDSWKVPPLKGLSGLSSDTVYRAVVRFVPGTPQTDNTAKLYSSEGAISPVPVSALSLKDIKTDPVKLQSIWRAGDYINIVLNVLVKDKSHRYNFIQNSISMIDNGDKKRLNITLYHDNNGDELAFYRTVYLSIPLWAYNDILHKEDEIEIEINTYKDGVVKSLFYY